ncbi:energy transducer TonB [Pseudothauera nasutitermitis]|uniref:Protein TonB n=1 Tax=Pseudothauera nasutitermitis TaxID=2565930 RepID=A0A4S4B3Q3_9RHOO|nr:energy transducer TonB [Pseudothauera nasutitermitis]THF67259.1 energy transducer TonB [Pseudothauera nasutitermitis]
MTGRLRGGGGERSSTHAVAFLLALGLHAALGAWMLSRPSGLVSAGDTPQPMFVALIDAPGPVAEVPEPSAVAEPPPAPQPGKPAVRPRAEPARPAVKPRKQAEEKVLETAAETALTSAREATEAAAYESPATASPAPAAESAARPAAAAAQGVPAAESARPVAYAEASYLHNPRPAYPLKARRQRAEGKVLLRVLVTEEGRPARVEIIASSGSELLDHAAREAVERWRFVAAKRGDSPVEATVVVPVVFKIGVG